MTPPASAGAVAPAPELEIIMVDWALHYASSCVPVFPCRPDKSPYVSRGFKAASVDPDKIREWWERWPDAMIGMPTGAASGCWVLDVDDVAAFDAAGINLPHTRQVKTGNGLHHYFQHDPDSPVRNQGKDAARPGTDIRGDGGYVILPPSLHPNGRRYELGNDLPVAPAPPELLQILAQRTPPNEVIPEHAPATNRVTRVDMWAADGALDTACMAIGAAHKGEQEFVLNAMALRMGKLVGLGKLEQNIARQRLIASGCAMTAHDLKRPWTPTFVAWKVDRALADGMASQPPTAADTTLLGGGQLEAIPYSWPDPSTIPRRQWIFGRWMLRGEVSLTIAPGGLGKTTLCSSAAVSLASGRDLLGQAPRERLGVWIYNLEDAPEELNRQIAAACLRHGVSRNECEGRLFVNSGITMPLCTATEGKNGFTINEEAFAQLTETIRSQGISAVFVDPLVSSHRVSEASNEAMDAIVKRWKRLAHETGCAVMLVHHSRKLSGREVTVEDGRGASALRDAARVVLLLNGMDKETAARLGLSDEQRRSLVRVDMGKASRSPGEDALWIKLESQSLGNEEGQEPADHVGVAVPWQVPAAHQQIQAFPVGDLQGRLGERDWRKDCQASDWVGLLIAEVGGLSAEENKPYIKSLQGTLIQQGWLATEMRKVKGKDCPCITLGRPFTTSHHGIEVGGEGGEADGL